MNYKERIEKINEEIARLQKEVEELIRQQKANESLSKTKLVEKMASLGFELNDEKIECYDDGVYYLMFSNKEDGDIDNDIRVSIYGNSNLSKTFFYEVYYSNYSTDDIFEIKDFLKIQFEINGILSDIAEVRKIMHKEFPQLKDFSDDFDREYDNFLDNRKVVK